MVSQKEAVFAAISSLEGFVAGAKFVLTDEIHAKLTAAIAQDILEGKVKYRNLEKLPNLDVAKVYTRGLITNWVRKDERLNGGVKYTPNMK